MTWEELKQKAKEMGASVDESEYGTWIIYYRCIKFFWDGGIAVEYSYYDKEDDENYSDLKVIIEDRTPDQMYSIMKALQ